MSDTAARGNLGLAYFTVGKLEEAIREYRLALRLNPKLAEAHAYYYKKEYTRALLHVDRAASLGKVNA